MVLRIVPSYAERADLVIAGEYSAAEFESRASPERNRNQDVREWVMERRLRSRTARYCGGTVDWPGYGNLNAE
jgi:hypothetical protein